MVSVEGSGAVASAYLRISISLLQHTPRDFTYWPGKLAALDVLSNVDNGHVVGDGAEK